MDALSFPDLIKNLTAALAAVGTIIGIPVAFFQVRKTIAEIRKIELETQVLKTRQDEQEKSPPVRRAAPPKTVAGMMTITDSSLHSLFLLLSDLIIVSIMIIIANYALDVFIVGPVKPLVLGIMSIILLVPIALEALRMRRALKGEKKGNDRNK